MGDLSEHFSRAEFASHDSAPTPPGIPSPKLIAKLEALRTALGDKPITIVSGYRSPAHNKAVGGAKNSQHVKGRAADIKVEGAHPSVVAQVAEKVFGWLSGIGVYETFTHCDVRLGHARWKG